MLFRRIAVGVVMMAFIGSMFPAPASAATAGDLQTSLSQMQLLLQSLLSQLSPAVKGASTIVVTNDAELMNAIKGVTGGETIQLAPGTYSNMQIVGGAYNQLIIGTNKTAKGVPTLTSPVTITSQDPAHPAVLPSIAIRVTSHWHLKGLAIRPVKAQLPIASAIYMIEGVDNTFEDSSISYGDATNWTVADWLAKAGDGVILGGDSNVVRNNTIQNVYMGISMYDTATHALIKNNTIDGIGGDGMRILADNVTVDSNFIRNFKKINDNHEDCSQSWGTASGTVGQDAFVRGVTFQNNICINNMDPNAKVNDPLYHPGLQGFDDFDGGTEGWLVQNNVFAGTAYHGIAYSGATNMTIRNNTILDSDATINGADNVWIMVFKNKTGTIQPTGNTFQNNISNKFIGYGSSSVVVNSQTVKIVDYDKYFRDWHHGDMRLLATSPIQGVGANLDPATVGSNVTVSTPVTTPAPTATLTSSVTSLTTGGSAVLTWTSTDAMSCTASGDWSGTKATTGTESMTVSTAGTKTYTLACTGTSGSVSKSVSVSVTDPVVVVVPPTASSTFKIGDRVAMTKQVNVRTTGLLSTTTLIGTNPTGSQGVLVAGPTVTSDRYGVITWFNVNFDSGFDGWVGADNYMVAPVVTPTTTTAAPALSMNASPAAIIVGNSSVVSWVGTNVTACTASGDWSGVKATSGTWATGLLSTVGTTTYTLTCSGKNGGSITKSVMVRAVHSVTIGAATTTTGVVTTATVNVRTAPNGSKVGTQLLGVKGILGSQPSVSTAGQIWVYVDFASGVDGWVARRYLSTTASVSVTGRPPITELQAQITALLAQIAALQQLLAQPQGR